MVLSRDQGLVSAAFEVDLDAQVEHLKEGQEGACVSQLVCDQQYVRLFLESSVGVLGAEVGQAEKVSLGS